MRKFLSCLNHFNDKGSLTSAPHGLGPVSAEAVRLKSQGSQMEMLDEPEMDNDFSLSLSTDSKGPVSDLKAHSAISSSLDEDLPSVESCFEELDVEGGFELGAAVKQPS